MSKDRHVGSLERYECTTLNCLNFADGVLDTIRLMSMAPRLADALCWLLECANQEESFKSWPEAEKRIENAKAVIRDTFQNGDSIVELIAKEIPSRE